MSRHVAVAITFGFNLLFLTHSAPSAIIIVDQQNTTGGGTAFGVFGSFTAGQTFTPTLSAIDAVEFALRDVPGGGTSPAFVRLYGDLPADGFTGATLLATSSISPPVANADFELYHFDLPLTVALVPGQLYLAEIVSTTDDGVQIDQSFANPYPSGELRLAGSNRPNQDFVFAEGVHRQPAVIPETASVATWVLLATMAAAICRGRSRVQRSAVCR